MTTWVIPSRAPAHRTARPSGPRVAARDGIPPRVTSIVAIGASMGGPRAVATVLGGLPIGFPVPQLVVLHLTPVFGEFMAEWLQRQVLRPVRLVDDGEVLPASSPRAETLLAPPDRHVVIRRGRLRLTREPARHGCRPSVDVLFESVAAELGPRAIGCLLTGMGKDGALGLLAMRRAGASTIVQDEETCAVFGMPREAIELRAAQVVKPLGKIAEAVARLAGHPYGRSDA